MFDYDNKHERLQEVTRELEQPGIWDNADRAQELGRERAKLEQVVDGLDQLSRGLRDSGELLEVAAEEGDLKTAGEIEADAARLASEVERLEFQRMFPGKMDS
ncbi:MAG: PCRF domain-containing protein, partial [Steroidobacteraceae bacterium]